MLVEDRLGNRLLGKYLPRLGSGSIFRLVVIHVKAKDIPVLNRVGDSVSVEFFLKQVLGGSQGSRFPFDLSGGRIVFEDRCASKSKKLRLWEELLYGFVILAKLRAVAFIKNEDHSFVAELFKPLLESWPAPKCVLLTVLVVLVKGETKLLNGRNDDLVCIIVGQETANERCRVGVFLDAVLLEPVELLAGLAVEILAVNDE